MDFTSQINDQEGIILLRSRFSLGYNFSKNLSFNLQLQDARVGSLAYGSRTSYEDSLDIRQANFSFGNLKEKAFNLKIGRIEFKLADERLVGPIDWSNISQSFDGINFNFLLRGWDFKTFALRRVNIEDGKINKWDKEDNFFGIFTEKKVTNWHNLSLFLFYRDTDKPIFFGPNVGSDYLKEYTLGFYFEGKEMLNFNYLIFGAYQFGDFGEREINARAFVFNLSYNFSIKLNPSLGIEYNYGSGDKDPLDDKRGTFDNLYPTGHKFYGYMDRASLQNLKDYALILNLKPYKDTHIGIHYHFINLDIEMDALYLASKKPLIQGEKGQSREVGGELDLTVNYKLNENLSLLIGYSYFNGGKFLRENGRLDDGEYFYFQGTINF